MKMRGLFEARASTKHFYPIPQFSPNPYIAVQSLDPPF
jgi:hypothetical protein